MTEKIPACELVTGDVLVFQDVTYGVRGVEHEEGRVKVDIGEGEPLFFNDASEVTLTWTPFDRLDTAEQAEYRRVLMESYR